MVALQRGSRALHAKRPEERGLEIRHSEHNGPHTARQPPCRHAQQRQPLVIVDAKELASLPNATDVGKLGVASSPWTSWVPCRSRRSESC
jgi:hypothetical protein